MPSKILFFLHDAKRKRYGLFHAISAGTLEKKPIGRRQRLLYRQRLI